jgi:hypothetical protein
VSVTILPEDHSEKGSGNAAAEEKRAYAKRDGFLSAIRRARLRLIFFRNRVALASPK